MNLVGEFTVSRTGSTDDSLSVWLHVSGSATPERDYEALPWLVSIPAGRGSASVPVTALYDKLPEGIETVIAQVSNCPPVTDPPLGAPCYRFAIDPRKDRDTVFIREDGLSTATVHINTPADGASFASGESVSIKAVAIHLESYLNRVEFFAGKTRLGVSEIHFVREPDPGTPIGHEFEWRNPPSGTHVLTARATPGRVDPIESPPVRITVGKADPNDAPSLTMVSPSSGASFPSRVPVPIVVEARDPDGFVPRMEFFADGTKIGEQNIRFLTAPLPNQLQTFRFIWEHPMPGRHVLTARATDNEGAGAESAPIEISVASGETTPTVRVVARDAFAVEPTPTDPTNTATFRIQRFGVLSGELEVRYSMHGRAGNGTDYVALPGTALIPAGRAWTEVTIIPLADSDKERVETVILRLEEQSAYRIAPPQRAVALISDEAWRRPLHRPDCRRVEDGLVHLRFPATSGRLLHLESSTNLRDWTTLSDLVADDGIVHVVDEAIRDAPVSFRRVTEGP